MITISRCIIICICICVYFECALQECSSSCTGVWNAKKRCLRSRGVLLFVFVFVFCICVYFECAQQQQHRCLKCKEAVITISWCIIICICICILYYYLYFAGSCSIGVWNAKKRCLRSRGKTRIFASCRKVKSPESTHRCRSIEILDADKMKGKSI